MNQYQYNQTPSPNLQGSLQAPVINDHNDEIDLIELFKILWEGKWMIIVAMLVFSVGAAIFAWIHPNIYESRAILIVDTDPYGFSEISGFRLEETSAKEETKKSLQYINSSSFRDDITLLVGNDFNGILDDILIESDGLDAIITVSKQSTDPNLAFNGVKLFSDNVNRAFKAKELRKSDIALNSTKRLIEISNSGTVHDIISEKQALIMYKNAILANPDSKLIQVISQPAKATSHVKPKRILIIILGIFIGMVIGTVCVVALSTFRRGLIKH